jgi:hypothetical protein
MQWHPLFAHLLRPVLEEYYEVQTNVPVGDVPREADIVLLRRRRRQRPPLRGIWRRLTEWNVLEFKGPSVSPRSQSASVGKRIGILSRCIERSTAKRTP